VPCCFAFMHVTVLVRAQADHPSGRHIKSMWARRLSYIKAFMRALVGSNDRESARDPKRVLPVPDLVVLLLQQCDFIYVYAHI